MSWNRYALDSIPDTFEGRLKVMDLTFKSEKELGRRDHVKTTFRAFLQGNGILLHEKTIQILNENGFTCNKLEV
jgi:hypothetical protein